jgi:hypothetical protein
VGKWAKTWGVVWLTAASLLAAPLLDEPVATLALKDGTVLREARAKGFLTKVVLVRHQGGVRTVPYELFPDEFQAALADKRQAVLTGAQVERIRREAEAQKRAQVQATPPAPVAAPSAVSEPELHQGCRLTFTSSKGNVVILKIENVSDQVVSLAPSQFVARTTAGEEFSGASWVGIYYKEAPMAAAWKNQRSVDPGTTVTLALTLTAPPNIKDGSIETVFWKKL